MRDPTAAAARPAPATWSRFAGGITARRRTAAGATKSSGPAPISGRAPTASPGRSTTAAPTRSERESLTRP
jgi:hypothetical protein